MEEAGRRDSTEEMTRREEEEEEETERLGGLGDQEGTFGKR